MSLMKVITGLWVNLAVLSWLLFLAGCGLITHTCQGYDPNSTQNICSQFKSNWWSVAYQGFCTLLAIILSARAQSMRRWRVTVGCLFAALVSLLMQTADSMDGVLSVLIHHDSPWNDLVVPQQVAMAGVVMLLVLDFIYLIMLTDTSGKWAPSFVSVEPEPNGSYLLSDGGSRPYSA